MPEPVRSSVSCSTQNLCSIATTIIYVLCSRHTSAPHAAATHLHLGWLQQTSTSDLMHAEDVMLKGADVMLSNSSP